MTYHGSRRQFLMSGTAAAVAGTLGAAAHAPSTHGQQTPAQAPASPARADYDGFSRYEPSRGNSPESDFYLGKLVPGFRSAEAGPAPFVAPDLEKLPYRQHGNVKEFELVAEPVQREFLPGYHMNVYGFNGSMPGPTIEVTQGDRVRIVVHNELPEETAIHWHGFELPVQYDGSATLTQNMIPPGGQFVYEFDVHEEGTFFYHSHVPMQEAFGMVGWFIVHPRTIWDPPVDRDFGLLFQNFFIPPNQTVADAMMMDWNWHTINGRSGPFTTPLVAKHGERVRIRILNFSPMQHHPVHIHGHTFWITGHEGARIPKSAWICRNTELIAVAQATDFELVANNPGDWMFHCHMVHHMMNHMVRQVGPHIRQEASVERYLADLDGRPQPIASATARGEKPPGYPQMMMGMEMTPEAMNAIWNRREVQGMRADWPKSLHGLMTIFRVLPDDLYRRVMEDDEEVPKGAAFEEIVRRFGTPSEYRPSPPRQS